MVEKDFQTRFTRWAKYNLKHTCACELKLVKGPSLAFSAIQPHQLTALRTAKHGNLVHKLSDFSIGEKPFDAFVLAGVNAYIVVMFYEERGESEFFMIDIDDFDRFVASSTRKSIPREDARSLATTIGILK